MPALQHRLLAAAVAVAAAWLPEAASAVRLTVGKPLNFTAVKNGDWLRAEVAKVQEKRQKKREEAAKVKAEKKAAAQELRKAMFQEATQAVNLAATHTAAYMSSWTQQQANRTKAAVEKRLDILGKSVQKNLQTRADAATRAIENNPLLNGNLFTTTPTTTPAPPCVRAHPGDKVVYFVHAADSENVLDGALTPRGEEAARRLRSHANLSEALSDGKAHARLIITGASRKSMRTALLAFKGALPDAVWEVDPDLELRHTGEPSPPLGISMLKSLGESRMLALYKAQTGVDHGGHEHLWQNYADRWHNFVDRLRNRTEESIIIVTDKWNLAMTGLEVAPANVGIAAAQAQPPAEDLYGDSKPSHAWQPLSTPGC